MKQEISRFFRVGSTKQFNHSLNMAVFPRCSLMMAVIIAMVLVSTVRGKKILATLFYFHILMFNLNSCSQAEL